MGGSNIYSAHGRILALSRDFYDSMEIPSINHGTRVLSTDQFLYYSCINSRRSFVLRTNAEVLFTLPDSFKDYLKQTVRFMYSGVNTKAFFEDTGFTNEFHVPLHLKVAAMLHLVRANPLGALAWTCYRAAARTMYLWQRYVRKDEIGAAWAISESTKDPVHSSLPRRD